MYIAPKSLLVDKIFNDKNDLHFLMVIGYIIMKIFAKNLIQLLYWQLTTSNILIASISHVS